MARKAKVYLTPPVKAPVPEPTPEEKAEIRKGMLLHQRDRVITNAEDAVNTMEQFLRTAKQRIDEVKRDPDAKDFSGEPRFLQLPESMLHEMAWGFANASGRIGNAIDAAQDYLRFEKESP